MKLYGNGITTVEELRKRYRELLKQHHPDNGGNEEIMKEINTEYDRLFAILSKESKSDGESTTYDDEAEDKAFREVLNQIIGYSMEIELIGSWIWCFNCYAYKDRLKELGFKFARRKRRGRGILGSFRVITRARHPLMI